MEIESYEEVSRYRHDFTHGDEFVQVSVSIMKLLNSKLYSISYSHTCVPEGAAGPYYSNSYTLGESLEDSVAKMHDFIELMAMSPKIVPWEKV